MQNLQMEFNYLNQEKNSAVVKITGEVDMKNVPEFTEFISKVLEDQCQKIFFDLQGLSYMSSTGFGVLASAAIEEKEKGERQIFFCNLHPTILNTYTLFGMEQVWPPYESIEKALKSASEKKEEVEKATFPLIKSCTYCHKPSNFAKPGHYKCPHCGTIHQLFDTGELKQVVRPKKKSSKDLNTTELVTDEIDISLPSDAVHLSRIRDFIFSFLTESFEEQDRSNMAMAVDEAVANAIEHAHKNDRNKKVYIHIELNIKKFVITIKDSGNNTFNSIIQKDNISQNQLKETGRGMGLILIKQMMDEVNLKPTETWGTAITMTKYVR